MNGNSQAVRIPAEFRFGTDRVQISRTPEADLLIHPCPSQRGQALLQALSGHSSGPPPDPLTRDREVR
jgi:antitoxin VapB